MSLIFLLCAGACLLVYWITAWTLFLSLAKLCGILLVAFWLIAALAAIFHNS